MSEEIVKENVHDTITELSIAFRVPIEELEKAVFPGVELKIKPEREIHKQPKLPLLNELYQSSMCLNRENKIIIVCDRIDSFSYHQSVGEESGHWIDFRFGKKPIERSIDSFMGMEFLGRLASRIHLQKYLQDRGLRMVTDFKTMREYPLKLYTVPLQYMGFANASIGNRIMEAQLGLKDEDRRLAYERDKNLDSELSSLLSQSISISKTIQKGLKSKNIDEKIELGADAYERFQNTVEQLKEVAVYSNSLPLYKAVRAAEDYVFSLMPDFYTELAKEELHIDPYIAADRVFSRFKKDIYEIVPAVLRMTPARRWEIVEKTPLTTGQRFNYELSKILKMICGSV